MLNLSKRSNKEYEVDLLFVRCILVCSLSPLVFQLLVFMFSITIHRRRISVSTRLFFFFFLLISCLPIPNSVKKYPSCAVLWIYHLLYLYLTFSFEIDASDPENECELSSEMHKLCEHFITMATVKDPPSAGRRKPRLPAPSLLLVHLARFRVYLVLLHSKKWEREHRLLGGLGRVRLGFLHLRWV